VQHGRPSGIRDAPVDEAMPWPAPPPGWTFDAHLALGGSARVFAARPTSGGKPAVVKLARWADPDIRERFAIEAEALAAVKPPWVPALLESGTIAGHPYLALERVTGESVAAWMARQQDKGGMGEILALLDRLAAALEVVHARGYVHRDIKPENLVIGGPGIRVLDFGLARRLDGKRASPTADGAMIGTPFYLAPEQLRAGGAIDARADVYAFGTVAFELVTGRPPFVGDRAAISYGHALCKPPRARELRPVPAELDELIAACMAKSPEQRPASAAAVRAWLTRAVASASTLVGVPPAGPAPGERGGVALVWLAGCDPIEVVRGVEELQGLVVRRRGAALLAAFTWLDHDAPLAAAVAAGNALVAGGGRAAIHHATALVRRAAGGRVAVYGEDVETPERWLPGVAWSGVVLSSAAVGELASGTVAAPDVPGFFRARALRAAVTQSI
jgi:eukaryotic-like serine/threonine-protein kinase